MNHKIDDIALHGALSANVVGFCRLLRTQGCGPALGEEQDALRALAAIDLSDPEDFRLSLRTILAKTPAEQKLFDAVFDVYWSVWDRAGELGQPQPEFPDSEKASASRPGKNGLTSVRDWLKQGEPTEEEREAAGYSPIEVHTKRDFKNFNAEELEEIGRLLQAIARALATRFSRRYRPARPPGRLDLRRTLRASLRRGGELLDLSYCRRTRQKPKLVLLCDVSKSMDLYSRFLIQFMYAFQNAYRRIETFVFATSLHHVAPLLRGNDLSAGLDAIAAQVPDWSGGTRIGAALETFLSEHADLVDHQTALVIVSDGWDTGDIEILEESMRALQRRSRCLIWLNPLLGSPDYRPATRGMQAALPYIDLFAPAHNIDSLKALVGYLMTLRGATAAQYLRRRPEQLSENPPWEGTPSFPRKRESSGGSLHTRDGTQSFQTASEPPAPTKAPTRADWYRRFGVEP